MSSSPPSLMPLLFELNDKIRASGSPPQLEKKSLKYSASPQSFYDRFSISKTPESKSPGTIPSWPEILNKTGKDNYSALFNNFKIENLKSSPSIERFPFNNNFGFKKNSLESSASPSSNFSTFQNFDFAHVFDTKEYYEKNSCMHHPIWDITRIIGNPLEKPKFDAEQFIKELNDRSEKQKNDTYLSMKMFNEEKESNSYTDSFGTTLEKEINKYDWKGNIWSESFGKSTDYIKDFPQGQLHIHSPNGFLTGAKLFNEDGENKISNYEAAMLDLQKGIVRKEKNKW